MNRFKSVAGWINILLGFLFHEIDGLMWALITLMILDYITGVTVAVIDKKLSASVGAKGIAKKVLIFVIVIIANIVDIHVIGSGHVMRSVTIMFYIANEAISVLENASEAGLPVPKKILTLLSDIRKKGNDDEH